MTPPGIVQPDLYVGFKMSSRPDWSKMSAPADTGIVGGAWPAGEPSGGGSVWLIT
jgi:hypothetical protein